jgi:hypothetical protein
VAQAADRGTRRKRNAADSGVIGEPGAPRCANFPLNLGDLYTANGGESLLPLAPKSYCREITTPAGVWTAPAVALRDTSPVPSPDGICTTLI